MLWLTWQMWILLALALLIGGIVGWMARGRSDEAETAGGSGTAAKSTAPGGTSQTPVRETPKAAAGSTPAPAPSQGGAKAEASESNAKPAAAKKAETAARAKPTAVPRHAEGESTHASQAGPDPVAVGAIAPAAPKKEASDVRRETRDAKTAGGEDLTRIRGLGPKAAEKLREAGVTTIDEIARWNREDVDRYDKLISGRGRITRDNWVGQAQDIAKG